MKDADAVRAAGDERGSLWLLGGAMFGFFVLLLTLAVLASRTEAQFGPAPFVVSGGLDSGRWAWRAWSDGRVEINDAGGQTGGGSELFKGWREVK